MTAIGTRRFGAIHIFPCGSATQNVIDFFAFGRRLDTLRLDNGTGIGACCTEKGGTTGITFLINLEQGTVQGAEPHYVMQGSTKDAG